MAEVIFEKTGDTNPMLGFWVVSCLAVSGAVSGAVFCSSPILVPVVVEVVLGALFLYRPTAAIKLMLFSAGLPLSLFYHEVGYSGGGVKPLFTEWGGTSPDGLRLILSCILLCVVLFKLEESRTLLLRFWPYTVMLLFMACTVFHSTAPVEGLRLFMKMLFPFLLFLAVAQLVKSSQEVDAYARYWIAGGIVASLCAPVLLLVTGSSFLYPAGLEFRLSPGFTSASSYSFYMLALFLYCYARWRKRHSFGFAVLTGVFGVQTVLPLTRIAWGALWLGLTAFELFYVKGRKKWLAATAVALPPLLILYALLWSIPTLQQRVFQSDQVDSDLPAIEQAQSVGLTGRGTTWLAGLGDYQEHNLLLGQGIGSSDRYFMTFFGTIAHNEYLRVLFDGGAIGLVLFIFANLSLLRWLVKTSRNENSIVRVYSAIGIALVLAYLVVAITDNPLDYYLLFTQYVFFVLGVCFAISRKTGSCREVSLGESRV
jgi:O-antigen ligase